MAAVLDRVFGMSSAVPRKPQKTSPHSRDKSARNPLRFTRASAAWVATAAALLLLVLMIIFMLQNSTRVTVHFLGLTGSLPLGMAMVIATVAGGVLVAIAGTARIAQLRANARRSKQPPV